MGEEYTPLGSHRVRHDRQQGQGRRGGRGVQHAQRRHQRGVLQGVHERRPDRRPRCRWSRCRSPRKRSRASAPQNLQDQLTAWNYYQTIDEPGEQKFVAAFKAKYGADRVTSDPMEAAYTSVYLWKAMVEKAEVVRRWPKGQGRRRRHHLRRSGGQGHGRRREPAHLQDGPDRQDRARRPDQDDLELREPIKPDPFLKSYDWANGLNG